MTFSATIIADSLHPNTCARLTTFVLKYPRFIHAELMTHRAISRNASSSRAIPVQKFVAWVQEDPAMPIAWLKNQSGMQGADPLSASERESAEIIWRAARDAMLPYVQRLVDLNVHKQITNRLLEPWHHISVIATATNWSNFFGLRYHKDAQPEIRELARKMLREYGKSLPIRLKDREWHLPYVTPDERRTILPNVLLKCSVARCARVSFNNHDGTAPNVIKDIELHDKLIVQTPLHASPAEHQAMVDADPRPSDSHGNLAQGWVQYRKTLANEVIRHTPELLPGDDCE